MRVDVNMTTEEKFFVSSWFATEPSFVIEALQKQLEAATAIWPDLRSFQLIEKTGGKARGGKVGGVARAAALTAERRSEIAKSAANARWNTGK